MIVAKKDHDSIAVRTLFLSDIHLGTRGCQALLLLEFLKRCDVETIYLVGDIIDGWRLKSGWYWPQAHNDVVQKLLRRVHKGAKLIYVPGNHDEFMRDYIGHNFGGVEILDTAIHEAADGKRYLVMHGDHFDMVVRHAPWLAYLGDGAYTLALVINTYVNAVRRRLGLAYWSLSAWAKMKVKTAVNHIGKFEELLALEARRRDVQGVICGHIHHAIIHDEFGVRYMNTGDWVESCTALVEHFDGSFEIIHWADEMRRQTDTEVVTELPRRRREAKASAA
ncbi:UDP-2,3-diacylglucosamine diphosphatase [Methylovirgula sp. HY1]|uniref:UDP-2,3-diacylglucosamine diphosphatase n=1 Tax=Methylovirgula sp. HY1 TaxID=2822761 RepID=UPI001C5BC4A5|nr:UDP-2,3-diacylglucosamine diphosphatase [Methylovirgula sp. HY1]QXX75251.1 UDP-2,3-diacylglucosamine hydrolase [Methylovirgula sp. HY1]